VIEASPTEKFELGDLTGWREAMNSKAVTDEASARIDEIVEEYETEIRFVQGLEEAASQGNEFDAEEIVELSRMYGIDPERMQAARDEMVRVYALAIPPHLPDIEAELEHLASEVGLSEEKIAQFRVLTVRDNPDSLRTAILESVSEQVDNGRI